MDFPEYSPTIFYRLIQQHKEAQLLLAAIRLGVCSYLQKPSSAREVAQHTQCDPQNMDFFLTALSSIGLLKKEHNLFKNSPETQLYLDKNSSLYLGEYFLFWEKKTSLEQVEELVRHGAAAPCQQDQGHAFYNFRELARLSATEILTGRVQSFLKSAQNIFPKSTPLHLLDLGGGSGRMALEFGKEYPQATGVIFEHPSVADIPAGHIAEEHLGDRFSIIQGDFTCDDIGCGYHLLIVSGVLDFGGDALDELVTKISAAALSGAHLYLVSHDVSDDYTAPKESIVGWLSSHLAGLRILMPKSRIKAALTAAGFQPLSINEQNGVISGLQGEWYRRD